MPNILDGLGVEGSVLDGLAEWPISTTRKEWFAITRQLIQQTIAEMDLDPAALAEVEEAFIGAGLLKDHSSAIATLATNTLMNPMKTNPPKICPVVGQPPPAPTVLSARPPQPFQERRSQWSLGCGEACPGND